MRVAKLYLSHMTSAIISRPRRSTQYARSENRLCEPLPLFGTAIQKVPGEHSRQRPSAGSHSSQTRYAISLSYLDHLEIGGRRCHNSLRMSRLTASFSIVPQPILTLRIPSLTSRSPSYHCGYLNWVIGRVVATRAFQSAHLPI